MTLAAFHLGQAVFRRWGTPQTPTPPAREEVRWGESIGDQRRLFYTPDHLGNGSSMSEIKNKIIKTSKRLKNDSKS